MPMTLIKVTYSFMKTPSGYEQLFKAFQVIYSSKNANDHLGDE